ncbi:hypothetical protein B9G69_010260 [Bdellovibrio sp. SKB1291214]|uniref:heavy-metal-associated domain-containing protein n=1 Tax=Bdellovibrio sp. SKB1291214 TaxID=1732569 RepID=UPI000B51D290|nr:heavy metal-associated domain-containing protein [Bdellovibrio sp. SKB1291214]UYL07428.1 hypothetical protein B9G69_010260 [Bdellovibrio sp. SKB1291214]
MSHQEYNVQGMTCNKCTEKISAELSKDPRIHDLKVTLNPPRIQFDSSEETTAAQINTALAPLKKYSVIDGGKENAVKEEPFALSKYLPLFLLFGLSAGVPALNAVINQAGWGHWMPQFMGVSLIALSYFKLSDLSKFTEAFATYDPIAMKFNAYGFIYPFFELVAGIGFILGLFINPLSVLVIAILLPTTFGVIKALREKRQFQCACLGTAFNLPLTKVTIVENILMIAMALMMLF